MRPPWPLIFLAAVCAIVMYLFVGHFGGSDRQERADSLARRGDSIAAAGTAGTDSTEDFVDGLVLGRSADEDTLIAIEDSLADLSRSYDALEAEGPRARPRLASKNKPRPLAAVALDTAPTAGTPHVCEEGDDSCTPEPPPVEPGPGDTLPLPTPGAVSASDSVTWLRQMLDVANRKILWLNKGRAVDGREKVRLASERDAWRDRAGILTKQLVASNAATHAVAEVAKGCSIPIVHTACPEVGVGPGVTVGVASNSNGTGLGAAAGLTLAVIFPLHKPR